MYTDHCRTFERKLKSKDWNEDVLKIRLLFFFSKGVLSFILFKFIPAFVLTTLSFERNNPSD